MFTLLLIVCPPRSLSSTLLPAFLTFPYPLDLVCCLSRHDPKLEFCELIIPTVDSVRYTYLLNLLIAGDKHVLMTGKGTISDSIFL